MIITLLDLVDPSAYKHFDGVVINTAVDAIKELKIDDRFDISFFRIVRFPHDPDTFTAQIHKSADTGGAYIGNVHFSTDGRRPTFETKDGCPLKRRHAMKDKTRSQSGRAFVKRSS